MQKTAPDMSEEVKREDFEPVEAKAREQALEIVADVKALIHTTPPYGSHMPHAPSPPRSFVDLGSGSGAAPQEGL